ncbi:MAG: 30S ribosome-binding factor RbfA [Nitrospirota bacterium]
MDYKRTDRVGDQIKMEVADILSKKVKDPRVSWVTILSVDVAPDLSHAKVFISVQKDEKATLFGLKKASGFIRSELARRLPLKRVPDLRFITDRSIESTSRLLGLLEDIGAQYKKEEEGTPGEQNIKDDGETLPPLPLLK